MRLIDVDNLKEKIENSDLSNHMKLALLSCVSSMPTISSSPNAPLTLNELREMDGEPVYVSGGRFQQWGLVHVYYDHDIFNGVEIYFTQYERIDCWDYGDDAWLAYRRKPEHSEA